MTPYLRLLPLACLSLLLNACRSACPPTSLPHDAHTVVIHQLNDPDGLNPLTSQSAGSSYIQLNIFQGLLATDFHTLKTVGLLAVERPAIAEINEGTYKGGMQLTYTIRPEARWDNGTPITAADVIFTVKAVLTRGVASQNLRAYYQFIDDIISDPDQPQRFTIYSHERYFLAESMGLNAVLPQYIYDPQQQLNRYTIAQIKAAPSSEPTLAVFARQFNEQHSRPPQLISGSGAYQLVAWQANDSICLQRKTDWWGDVVANAPQLSARPQRLVYRVVNDWPTAIQQLQQQQIDVAYNINAPDFVSLRDDACFTQHYALIAPLAIQYDYLCLNTRRPVLADSTTRRALAHLVDKRHIIQNLLHGLAQPIVGPVHPSKSYYNRSLHDLPYDPPLAQQLLQQADWKDTNNDGILDKTIQGKRTDMRLRFLYPQGDLLRQGYGLQLQAAARTVGIEVHLYALSWQQLMARVADRQFDMLALGAVQSTAPDDLSQTWHTLSDTPDGANRSGFGNTHTDSLINRIGTTLDEAERRQLYLTMQQIIYDQQPYIFLVSPQSRIALHQRLGDVSGSVNRPGFDEKTFAVPPPPATAVSEEELLPTKTPPPKN